MVLYGSKRDNVRLVVESYHPHLYQLDAIVADKEAISALRAGYRIEEAFEKSRPPGTVFEESLLAAKRYLEKAQGSVTTGYDGSEYLLRIAGSVEDMAYDLREDIKRKRAPRRDRRPADKN